MGKYMKKSKATGDVAVMEVAVAQSSLGVRTRAKTLALRQLGSDGGSSYLQLRSRKLEKPALIGSEVESRKLRVRQVSGVRNPNPNFKNRGGCRSRLSRVSSKLVEGNDLDGKIFEDLETGDGIERIWSGAGGDGDGKIEAFIGENSPDFVSRDRSTRESTPCSFIRDPDNSGTPSSTTRTSSSIEITKRRRNSSCKLLIPTAREIEEFFAGSEQQRHRNFIEKYNFDPVNEKPLPGRYDWVEINQQLQASKQPSANANLT